MGESTKSPMSASKYYGILEISKSASLTDICKAYKHLVKKWHPDRNKSNQAEAVDKFRSINEAYRVCMCVTYHVLFINSCRKLDISYAIHVCKIFR